ncbi:MAG TPA: tRNA (adenosine(37)-N6)-dimethylallyltransferase MiaA [Candidatus Binataceae bacterium]|nr:tRNA (adenosine(37)-N6)-dimethylallyltransferase MiaA [Candidatus Binataceae bacterium]
MNAPVRIRVGFIVGPTGSGKTALALEVAQALGAEIVNADSRLFYCAMDIGTAKPTDDERRRVPHHLIDIRNPDEPLDVAAFGATARERIAEIAGRGNPVLVVGGSGLYLRVLRGGIFAGPPASPEIRARLAAIAAEHGVPHLHESLRAVDAVAANRIHVNDLYRITRALEVYELSGEPISRHQERHAFAQSDFDELTLAIETARELLYENIDRRFDAMVAAGLVDEVRALLSAGYSFDRQPLNSIGYAEIAAYLRGELTLKAAIENAKRESRRLAKRQLTWFRHQPGVVWLDPLRAPGKAREMLAAFFAGRAAPQAALPAS